MTAIRHARPTRRLILRSAACAIAAGPLGHPLARAALRVRSTVEVTEGPYFVDELLNRSDIRVDPMDGSVQAGLPMLLSVSVHALDTASGKATPLPGAMVDIWHCNAQGQYSDVAGSSTEGRKFLRGYQVSDAQGRVQFRSIYPGWYPGRSPHIHAKVRQPDGSLEFTTQFFFDEALTREVYADAGLPYHAHGQPDQPHASDQVYSGSDGCAPGAMAGDSLMLALARGARQVTATFDLLIDATQRCTSEETGMDGPPPDGPPPGGSPRGTPPTR